MERATAELHEPDKIEEIIGLINDMNNFYYE